MKALQVGIASIAVFVASVGLHADDSLPKEIEKKVPSDAELLGQLKRAARAIDELEVDLGLFDRGRAPMVPKNRVPPRQTLDPRVEPELERANLRVGSLLPPEFQKETMSEIEDVIWELQPFIAENNRRIAQRLEQEPQRARERIDLQELEVLATRAWQSIGAAQVKLGDLAGARESWKKVVFRASVCSNAEELLLILRDMAFDQEAAGDRNAALKTLLIARDLPSINIAPTPPLRAGQVAGLPSDPTLRTCAILAKAFARIGADLQLREALLMAQKLAESGEDPVRRSSSLMALATIQPPDEARSTRRRATRLALREEDPLEQTAALEAVLRACIIQGDQALALESLRDALAKGGNSYLVWTVADELATGTSLPETKSVAQLLVLAKKARFKSAMNADRVFARIALAQARLGDDAALQTLELRRPAGKPMQVVDLVRKLDVMYALARTYLKAGKRDAASEAVQVAVEVADAVLADDDLAFPPDQVTELVRLQAQTGDLAGALRTAESIKQPTDRITALAALAAEQGKAGKRDLAQATIAKARAAIDEIANEELWRFTDVMRHLPPTARRMTVSRVQLTKAQALHKIGSAQVAMADFNGAFETAESMRPYGRSADSERAALYAEVAAAKAQTRDFQGALSAIGMAQDADSSMCHVLRIPYLREVAHDDLTHGKVSQMVQFCIELANEKNTADSKLQLLSGYADGVVALRSAQASGKLKSSAARDSSP